MKFLHYSFGLFGSLVGGDWVFWIIGVIVIGILFWVISFSSKSIRRLCFFVIALVCGFYISVYLLKFFGVFDRPAEYVSVIKNPTKANGDFQKNPGQSPVEHKRPCGLPRGGYIKHGSSTQAYRLRGYEVCDIERRICNDGVLGGSYVNGVCGSSDHYSNDEKAVISGPSFSGVGGGSHSGYFDGSFYIEGKEGSTNGVFGTRTDGYFNLVSGIDGSQWHGKGSPTGSRGGSIAGIGYRYKSRYLDDGRYAYNTYGQRLTVQDIKPIVIDGVFIDASFSDWSVGHDYHNCTTPRGDTALHGNFVRAYYRTKGDTELPCFSELRLCSDGDLMGSFSYKDCLFVK